MALFILIGLCCLFTAESSCPTDGTSSRTSSRLLTCISLFQPTQVGQTITWSDGDTSLLNYDQTFVSASGVFVGEGNGTVTSGKFIGGKVTMAWILVSSKLDVCGLLNGNSLTLNGTATINIIGTSNNTLINCPLGDARVEFNPAPLIAVTNTTITRVSNYNNCVCI